MSKSQLPSSPPGIRYSTGPTSLESRREDEKPPESSPSSNTVDTPVAEPDPVAEILTLDEVVVDHAGIVVVSGIPFICKSDLRYLFHGGVTIGLKLKHGQVIAGQRLIDLVKHLSGEHATQEGLTTVIAAAISDVLSPEGVGVVITAEHATMPTGVKQVTSTMLGCFRRDAAARSELLALISKE